MGAIPLTLNSPPPIQSIKYVTTLGDGQTYQLTLGKVYLGLYYHSYHPVCVAMYLLHPGPGVGTDTNAFPLTATGAQSHATTLSVEKNGTVHFAVDSWGGSLLIYEFTNT